MVRPRGSKTIQCRYHIGATPYQHVYAKIGTEVQIDVDSDHAANSYIDALDAMELITEQTPVLADPQTMLETQRQEWADFLAQVAIEAEARCHKGKSTKRHQKSNAKRTQWTRIKEKTRRQEKNNNNQKQTLQSKFSRRYMNKNSPTNWSALSTIDAISPPIYPRSNKEIEIMNQLPREHFKIQTPI